MKQAVIEAGGKQHIVSKNQEIMIERVGDKKQITFQPLLVFDEKNTKVGTPYVEGAKVTAKVLDLETKGNKVIATRYKPKKRVHKRQGHRQRYSRVKITGITEKQEQGKEQKEKT